MSPLLARCGQFLRQPQLRSARKLVVAVVGGTVALVGIAMVVLPGPAILVIPMGLAILATEFLWARRWLQRARAMLSKRNKQSPAPLRPSNDGPIVELPAAVVSGEGTDRECHSQKADH